VLKETGYPPDQTNVNGGAIALAHPLGATGVKAHDHAAARAGARQKRWGLQTMCRRRRRRHVTIIERWR